MAIDLTAINLLLAGDDAGARAALEGNWPDLTMDTILGAVLIATEKKSVTSGSTVSIGTGAKVFTLDETRPGWLQDMPIFIARTGFGSTHHMRGYLTADETGGTLTVFIDDAKGAPGPWAAWTMFALFTVTTVASPPLAIADGGTGASDALAARAALKIPHFLPIAAVEHNSFAAAVFVTAYPESEGFVLVADPQGADQGDFAGHVWELAHLDDPGPPEVWSFSSQAANSVTLLWSIDARELWGVFGDDGSPTNLQGVKFSNQRPQGVTVTQDYGVPYDVDVRRWDIFVDSASQVTVTLPSDLDSDILGNGIEYRIWREGTGDARVIIGGGGDINGGLTEIFVGAQGDFLTVVQKSPGFYRGN